MAAATREGPSRFTSTAVSSGASNATAAAEWTTMSDGGEHSTSLVVEAETLRRDVAGDGGQAALPPTASNPSPSSARRRSKQSLRTISRLARSAALDRRVGRTRTATRQPGTDLSRRSTRAVPRNPVAPVTKIRRPVEGIGNRSEG